MVVNKDCYEKSKKKFLPFLSICIPAYNKCERLKENLSNLIACARNDIEIIVCDNCSTDKTVDVIDSFEDPRIVFYRNDVPISGYDNWFRSISLARGKFAILFMDRDLINATSIPELIDILKENSGVAAAYAYGCSEDDQKAISVIEKGRDRVQRFPSLTKEAIVKGFEARHPSGNIFNVELLKNKRILDKYMGQTTYQLSANSYCLLDLGRYGDFIKIKLLTWISPGKKYMSQYCSGMVAGNGVIPYFEPKGRTRMFCEDVETLQSMPVSLKVKQDVYVELYKRGLINMAGSHFVPRNSFLWGHYGVKYKYYGLNEIKKDCEHFKDKAVSLGWEIFDDQFETIKKDIHVGYISTLKLIKWRIIHVSFIESICLRLRRIKD